MIKFGKKLSDVFSIKKNFYLENDTLLKKQKKISKIYKKQPLRKNCKACNKKLKGKRFLNHTVVYIECNFCGHINGKHQDTEKFSDLIYKSNSINYSKNYYSKNLINFKNRQKKIYNPKAIFLKEGIKEWKKMKILDFGCGSGYFVSSLTDSGFRNVRGCEVSLDQINYGKKIFRLLKKDEQLIYYVDSDNIFDEIKRTDATCISVIGVLEHLVDLQKFLNTVKLNKSIKYIYLCVPMFSLSSIVENSFDNIFNRQLGGGHTHLFTEQSLKNMMKKINFKEISTWWFGSDFSDLLRSFMVKANKKNEKPLINQLKKIQNQIDSLQLILDKKKMSSQVHMILKRQKETNSENI